MQAFAVVVAVVVGALAAAACGDQPNCAGCSGSYPPPADAAAADAASD